MSDVCTLYSGNYHFGVAALINSLCANSYSGRVWVGFKDALPPWASLAKEMGDYSELDVTPAVKVCFIKVHTEMHLTYYKPAFMQMLLERYCQEAKSLFYFDADIVVKSEWSFFEKWVSFGVAVVEDDLSPLSLSNPVRSMWREFYKPHGFEFIKDHAEYVNGGFLGLHVDDKAFLDMWRLTIELLPIDFKTMFPFPSRKDPFLYGDQDALNVAISCTSTPVSIMNKNMMDFGYEGSLMSHAINTPKPWNAHYTNKALLGYGPKSADRFFYRHINGPIKVFSDEVKLAKILDLRIGQLISWFFAKPY